MKNIRQASAAFLVLALFSVAHGQTQPEPLPVGSATVASFKGQVTLRSPKGEALEPKQGLVLEPESVIETARGSVMLNLQDGSQVLVKSKSQVILKSPNTSGGFYLQLLIGKVLTKIQKRLENAPSFRMGTPTAVITVRGTRFEVEVSKQKRTFVEVYEGLVEVIGLGTGGRPVILRPGFFTRVERDRGPAEPRERFDRDDRDDSPFDRRPGGEREDRDRPDRDSSKPDSGKDD